MNETLEHIVANPKERKLETPIFLQHGAFCWENFIDYFASLGYEVRAISLPGHGKSSLNKGNINKYSMVEAGGG